MTLKRLRTLVLVAFTSAMLAQPVMGEPVLSGDLEIDTDYEASVKEDGTTDDDGDPDDEEITKFNQGGRGKISVKGRKSKGTLFGTGEASIEAGIGGSLSIADVYVTFGSTASKFNVLIGRYEAAGLYSKGADVLFVGAPDGPGVYEVNFARGRGPGAVGLQFKGIENVSLELNIIWGNDDDGNKFGFRPYLDFNVGPFTGKAAFEQLNITAQDNDSDATTTKSGGGVLGQISFGSATLGVNVTSSSVTGEDADGNDIDTVLTTTVGGFVTVGLGSGREFGVGLHQTSETTEHEDTTNDDGATVEQDDSEKDHTQWFASYTEPLPLDGAAVKFAVSGASANVEDGEKTVGGADQGDPDEVTHTAIGYRVRINYSF